MKSNLSSRLLVHGCGETHDYFSFKMGLSYNISFSTTEDETPEREID